MIERDEPPAGPDPDPLFPVPPEASAPGAEESLDPYARQAAIEQLTGPEDDDD